MIDIDALPVPDWGLQCPSCDAPLAGMPEHRCEQCHQPFNIRHLLGMQRPVPDLGLACEECGYLLTGLTTSRCPECGTEFSVRERIDDQSPSGALYLTQAADPEDHHVKKREPVFTGQERPLPEFGLYCSECEHPLAGAPADDCPNCDTPFDLSGVVPRGDWVNISRFIPPSIAAVAKLVLYENQIPYVIDNARLSELYGGNIPFVSGKLRVPRPFFFDALNAFTVAAHAESDHARESWTCPSCNERVPAGFDVCWNCNAPYPDETGDLPRGST